MFHPLFLQKLGRGWQYTTYDLENGRVFKKFNSWPRALWIVSKGLYPFERYPIWNVPRYIKSAKQKALQSFKTLERRQDFPLRYLANPVRLTGLDYEQDKIIPLHKVFETASLEEAKHLVDLFILFQQELLAHKLIDKYFNIANNFGLNDKGEIVLADIGELLEDETAIQERLKARPWAESYILRSIKNIDLQKYFVEEMDKNLGI